LSELLPAIRFRVPTRVLIFSVSTIRGSRFPFSLAVLAFSRSYPHLDLVIKNNHAPTDATSVPSESSPNASIKAK
jgi:hypothetical protein